MKYFAGSIITVEGLVFFVISSFFNYLGPLLILSVVIIIFAERKNRTSFLFKGAIVTLLLVAPPTAYVHTVLFLGNLETQNRSSQNIDSYFDSLPEFYLPKSVPASKSTIYLVPDQPETSGSIKFDRQTLGIEKITDTPPYSAAEKFLGCDNTNEPTCQKQTLGNNRYLYTKKLTPNPQATQPFDYTRCAIVINSTLITGGFETNSEKDMLEDYAKNAVKVPRSSVKKIYGDEKFLNEIEKTTH